MAIKDWFDLLITQLKETGWIEWIAVVSGVGQVLLARANKIWLYPVGIVSTIASVYVLFNIQLYAEVLLNIYYLLMSIYGWLFWSRLKNKPQPRVSFASRREWVITWLIAGLGWALLYVFLKYGTSSNVPLWDSFVSATAWAGMWLLARRKVENWLLLNLSNLFAIPLLFYKQLPLFAALTLLLFAVAVAGYYDWKKLAIKDA